MTRIGTNRFVSRAHAVRYYAPYGFDEHDVDEKLLTGEIAIGCADMVLREGEKLIPNTEGRYVLLTA